MRERAVGSVWVWRVIAGRRLPAILVVLLIGFGVGATTTVFTLVDNLLRSALAFPDPDRIVAIGGASVPPDGDVIAWWGQARSIEDLTTYSLHTVSIGEQGQTDLAAVAIVSRNFFDLVKVHPVVGRPFLRQEELPGNRIVILSSRCFRKRFGEQKSTLGRTVPLSGVPYKVIGVLPVGFEFLGAPEFFVPGRMGIEVPAGFGPPITRSQFQYGMLARLAKGVEAIAAQQELLGYLQALNETMSPRTGIRYGDLIAVNKLRDLLVAEARPALITLSLAALFVLFIACANAACILLASAAAREDEMVIRLCLGATNLSILKETLSHSTWLPLVGGLIGVFTPFWLVRVAQLSVVLDILPTTSIAPNARICVFALSLTLGVGALAGLLPGVLMVRHAPGELLRVSAARATKAAVLRWYPPLVVIQLAMTVVLLSCAVQFMLNFLAMIDTKHRFDPERTAAITISLADPRNQDSGRFAAFEDEILKRKPGAITAFGFIDRLQIGSDRGYRVVETGRIQRAALSSTIAGDYFRVLGIRVLRGRTFTPTGTSPQDNGVVVTKTLAQAMWAGEEPIGKPLLVQGELAPRVVIGVVEDMRFHGSDKLEPQFYLHHRHSYRGESQMSNSTLVFSSPLEASSRIREVFETIHAVDPNAATIRALTFNEMLSALNYAGRVRKDLVLAAALVALVVSLSGVYGFSALWVENRQREIGVRLALGARPLDVFALVLGRGLGLGFLAVIFGLALSFWVTKVISAVLVDFVGFHPAVLSVAMLVVLIAVGLGMSLPAIRASLADPAVVLRQE